NDHRPAPDSEQRAEQAGNQADDDQSHSEILRSVDAIARLAENPDLAAVILDVDGTLAPIVPRPEDAAVPPDTRAELERLAGRYRPLAFVSGGVGEDARRMVGVEGATYVGVHGLELEPAAAGWRE